MCVCVFCVVCVCVCIPMGAGACGGQKAVPFVAFVLWTAELSLQLQDHGSKAKPRRLSDLPQVFWNFRSLCTHAPSPPRIFTFPGAGSCSHRDPARPQGHDINCHHGSGSSGQVAGMRPAWVKPVSGTTEHWPHREIHPREKQASHPERKHKQPYS